MKATRALTTAGLLLTTLLVVACGGPDDSASTGGGPGADGPRETPAGPPPLPGAYVVDEARMRRLDAEAKGLDPDAAPPPGPAVKVQDYRIVLAPEGTFTLTSGMDEVAFSTAGTWKRVGDVLEMVTTTLNGEPAPEEVSSVTDRLRIEPGALVLEQGALKVFLRREPDEARGEAAPDDR